MEIKITIQQDQKQAVSRDFSSAKDALEYLESLARNLDDDTVVSEEESEDTEETEDVSDVDNLSAPAEEIASKDFTNDQRFDPGQHIVFHQLVGEYAGEHVVIEEREEEVGFSYRTDKSGETFIHAHWFAPVRD